MMIILTQVPLLLQLLLQVSNLRMVRYHLLFSAHQGSLSKLQELSLSSSNVALNYLQSLTRDNIITINNNFNEFHCSKSC